MDTAHAVEIAAMAERRTKRKSFMQVMVCVGCCCGRPDRGKPDVPVDWLKAQWKAARLNPRVQLTISGCLGPCDLPNVVAILSPAGQQWLGQLNCQEHFEALVQWGRACGEAGHMVRLPEVLSQLTFGRFEAGG